MSLYPQSHIYTDRQITLFLADYQRDVPWFHNHIYTFFTISQKSTHPLGLHKGKCQPPASSTN